MGLRRRSVRCSAVFDPSYLSRSRLHFDIVAVATSVALIAAAAGCAVSRSAANDFEPLLTDYSGRVPPPIGEPCVPSTGLPANAPQRYRALLSDMLEGDDARRAEAMTRCEAEPTILPLCHRSMGIAFARAGRGAQAVHHYRRYVALAPDACDVDQVRKLLEAFGM